MTGAFRHWRDYCTVYGWMAPFRMLLFEVQLWFIGRRIRRARARALKAG